MDNMELLMSCKDSMELVSVRLGVLHSMLDTLQLGMKVENMEQQAIDCIGCVGYFVNDIKHIAVDGLEDMEKLYNSMDGMK